MRDADALKRLDHVEAVLAIQKLKHTYWHYNDTGLRGDEIAQLFTEDGVWSNAELGHYEGREAIRTFFNGASEAIPLCAHVGMNEIIDIDGDTAREVGRVPMGERSRQVVQGPDGAIWALEDGDNGRLLKLTPG